MAKIVLGQRPEKFTRLVKFPMLDGTDGVIKCEFKFRTKTEYAELVDSVSKATRASLERPDGELPDYAEIMREAASKNAGYMKDILLGWDLEGEINDENLQEISNTYPAATQAILDAYRVGCIEGKLGN